MKIQRGLQGSQGEIYSLSQDTVYPSSIREPSRPSIDSPFAALASAPITSEYPLPSCSATGQWHAVVARPGGI